MSNESYVDRFKDELIRIYGEVSSGRIIETIINPNIKSEDFESSCILDTIIIHRHMNGIVDFPLKYPKELDTDINDTMISNLQAIILCEEETKKGNLISRGTQYIHKTLTINNNINANI